MLIETVETRQISEEPFRRWFADPELDLIVWYEPERTILGLQLCYRVRAEAKALTWIRGRGFSHRRLDEGDDGPGHKMTPILLPDGTFDAPSVLERFTAAAARLDPEIVRVVTEAIGRYPDAGCGVV